MIGRGCFFFVVFSLVLATTAVSAQPPPAASAAPDARELANQVNNPAAPVTLLQFRDILLPDVHGANGATNVLEIQPVLPIGPFASLPIVQLLKITLPFPSLPSPASARGTGDMQLFDLITIRESWGDWGFGPALVFPTASASTLGSGKWQAGPAAAVMYTRLRNLTAGAVWQNPVSYAGAGDRPDVNSSIITPTLTYNLPNGWFAGLSDYDTTFDWTDGGAATVILGAQVGRVVRFGTQAISLAIEVGGAATRPSTTPNPGWIIGIEVTPIFRGHIK